MGANDEPWSTLKDWRADKKEKKRAQAPAAIEALKQSGIPYRTFNGSEHYRIDERFDWWPSTGYWRALKGKRRGGDVKRLIAIIQREKASA